MISNDRVNRKCNLCNVYFNKSPLNEDYLYRKKRTHIRMEEYTHVGKLTAFYIRELIPKVINALPYMYVRQPICKHGNSGADCNQWYI